MKSFTLVVSICMCMACTSLTMIMIMRKRSSKSIILQEPRYRALPLRRERSNYNRILLRFNLTQLEERLDRELEAASEKVNILIWYPPEGVRKDKSVNRQQCGYCDVTYNRSVVSDPATKAVVFHFLETKLYTMPQTTRRDSDVFAPYGHASMLVSMLDRGSKQMNEDDIDELINAKTKHALWVASNCNRTAGAVVRMNYVMELIDAGLKVDLRGKCFPGSLKSWRTEDYRFYLAFENSVYCKDYISEKFFVNALASGVVPVVFGASKQDYEEAAPTGSFIYARDFTPSGLVRYLRYLTENDFEYKKYFDWRTRGLDEMAGRRRAFNFCSLCRMLHGINFDNIFHPSYDRLVKEIPLFGFSTKPRKVSSLRNWFYGSVSKQCFQTVRQI